jgi:hypothetical protein
MSTEVDYEKLVSDNEEFRSRIEKLETDIVGLKKDEPVKQKIENKKVKKLPDKKTLKDIVASWEEGKSIGLCPRFIAGKDNKTDHDYCGQKITGYHDKEGKWILYEHDDREKDEDFLINIEEFCRSRCDKCVNKGLAATAKHTKNIIQAVKGEPEATAKSGKRNVVASVSGISIPETVSTPSPDAGEKIIVGNYIDQIVDIENLRVVLRRVRNKDGTPRKNRKPRIIGCYYNEGDEDYNGENVGILCKLPGEAIRKLGNCLDETKDLPPLSDSKDEEDPPEEEEEQSKPSLKVDDDDDDDDEGDDDGTADLLKKISI